MFDLVVFLKTIGLVGLFGVIFAESGLLIGFFFPGDSLLFTAGFLASQGFFPIIPLALGSFIAAVAGDSVGYAFGKRIGPALFTREDSLFFHKDHIERARRFYEAHGKKTIVLARFLPVVRTFAPILAGVGRMEYRVFISYNIIGALIWAVGMTVGGYFFGNIIPHADRYIIPIVVLIIVVSIAPSAYHVLANPVHRQQFIAFIKSKINKR